MASVFLTTWEKTKKEFETVTGKSKPKPNGKIAKAFNHSGLTGDLKSCDKYIDAIDAEVKDDKKRAKLVAAGEKHIAAIRKSTSGYISVLDKAIKDEVADNNEKTTYSKGLKILKTQLDAIEKRYEAKIEGYKAHAGGGSTDEKMIRQVHKGLQANIAEAANAIKRIKADPTPATYNKYFNTSNNTPRKVQMQLVIAEKGHKAGKLPAAGMKRVDPGFVAKKFTPWQAENRPDTKADDTWDKAKILSQLKEFSNLLKLANAYTDDLNAAK